MASVALRSSHPMNLSAPKNSAMYAPFKAPQTQALADPNALVPPYGARTNFIPRKVADYGDGGAFPEIHIKQYPLDMGRQRSKTGNALQLRIDQKGEVNYDVVVREGARKGKHIFTQLQEAEKMDVDDPMTLARPSREEAAELIKKAREGMEKQLKGKISATSARDHKKKGDKPVYVRYTPADQNQQHNSGARSRIIKVHTMQVDPLEPPKFKHKKLPAAPPSPPVPIMRSPPRSITQEDQKNWKIPPCVSNWKNNRGYAIPLHQRLATTGRNLTDAPINDRFASLAEALYFAERMARQEVESRARDRKSKAEQLRQKREADLTKIAKETQSQMATGLQREIETPATREINTPFKEPGTPSTFNEPATPGGFEPTTPSTFRDIRTPNVGGSSPGGDRLTREQIEARNERDRLREKAKRQRKRQMGLEKAKRQKPKQRRERDISEQIALGENVASAGGNAEVMFDQRLFNRDSGISQGFAADDNYDIYDKPMSSSINQHVYRPPRDAEEVDEEEEMKKILNAGPKFQPHQGFKDTDEPSSRRDGPVQFEKMKPQKEEDPFALAQMAETTEKKESKEEPTREEERRDRGDRDDRRDRRRRRDREREDDRDRGRRRRRRDREGSEERERKRRKKREKRRRDS